MEQTIVEIDTKEPLNIFDEFIFQVSIHQKFNNLKAVRNGLLIGDFRCGNVGAERKEIYDFIASIYDGRLFKQVRDMVDNYEYAYLIVEGDISKLGETKIESILTTIADFEFRYGIRIRFVPDKAATSFYFLMLVLKHDKDLKPVYKLHRPKLKDMDYELLTLMGLPNVGEKTAKLLLNHFKTIKIISNASIDEIKQIKGIGITMATRIYNVLNGIKEDED